MQIQTLNIKLPYRVNNRSAALVICYKPRWDAVRFFLENFSNGSSVELTGSLGRVLINKLSYVNAVPSSIYSGLPEVAYAIVNGVTVYRYEDREIDTAAEKVLDSGYARSSDRVNFQIIEDRCRESGRIGDELTELLAVIREQRYQLVSEGRQVTCESTLQN